MAARYHVEALGIRHLPLQAFEPIQPPILPETWAAGSYLVRLKAFGLFPMGTHTIVISFPTESAPASRTRQILDNGHGSLASSWKHLITVAQTPDATVVYTDEVEIRAGWLTLAVWFYAQGFFRYRQYRWRRLVRRGFSYE